MNNPSEAFDSQILKKVEDLLDRDVVGERHHTADIFHNLGPDHPRELVWCRVSMSGPFDLVVYRGETKEEVDTNRALFRLSTTYTAARLAILETSDE